MKKKVKISRSTQQAKFFLLITVIIWAAIISLSFFILKTGGHLKPRAASQIGNIANGRVVGRDGEAVVGAKITLSKDSLNNYLFSDSGGSFIVENIALGTYSILIDAQGYAPYASTLVLDSNTNSYTFTVSKDH